MPRRFSLLVADDDAGSRDAMAQVLERDGYRVLRARCGQEAIDLAQEESLNGLILEMHLPDLTGLETLQRLDDRLEKRLENRPEYRHEYRRLPSILVSSEPWKELQLEALDIGVFAFIQKPVREEILRVSVARLLDRSGGEDALRLSIQVYQSQSIEIARNEMTRNEMIREEIILDRKQAPKDTEKDKEKSNGDENKN